MTEKTPETPKSPNPPVKKWVRVAFIGVWIAFVVTCVAAFVGAIVNC